MRRWEDQEDQEAEESGRREKRASMGSQVQVKWL